MLLAGKTAVIYGAAGGVGSAVARAFARDGARLFLAGRTLAKLEAIAAEVGGGEAAEVDALDEQAVERHIADVDSKAGGIDILFNAIAMQDVQGPPLVDMSVDDFTRPIAIAMRTQFLTARAVARRMVRRGRGVIMTITGGPARRAVAHVGGFDTASAALEGLWRTFAAELGPSGVRLVVVGSAGSPDTPDVQEVMRTHARARGKSVDEMAAAFGRDSLLGRLPGVDEVARAATIMASDYASAMTGVIANVTCGFIVD
jgi:3-oxoacyl-[acyl-carrier protein] reductase